MPPVPSILLTSAANAIAGRMHRNRELAADALELNCIGHYLRLRIRGVRIESDRTSVQTVYLDSVLPEDVLAGTRFGFRKTVYGHDPRS